MFSETILNFKVFFLLFLVYYKLYITIIDSKLEAKHAVFFLDSF